MQRERWKGRDGFGTTRSHIGDGWLSTVFSMSATAKEATATASTPWGPASLLEELKLPQQAGEKRFSSLVQLLETKKGERLVRFAYATDGTARRGPVTLRARDLERLRALLEKHPRLKETLRL